MSFSSNRKDEIIAHQYKSKCCKKALLSGALFAKGELKENKIYLKIVNTLTKPFKNIINTPAESCRGVQTVDKATPRIRSRCHFSLY